MASAARPATSAVRRKAPTITFSSTVSAAEGPHDLEGAADAGMAGQVGPKPGDVDAVEADRGRRPARRRRR